MNTTMKIHERPQSAVVTRKILASPAAVYRAVTDPAKLRRWLGPADFETFEVVADLKVGGEFRFRMRRIDGECFGAEGVYCEVVPDRRVVLTWKWNEGPDDSHHPSGDTLVTIEVRAVDGGSEVTLTHDRLYEEGFVQSHTAGWMQSLDKLERLFGRASPQATAQPAYLR